MPGWLWGLLLWAGASGLSLAGVAWARTWYYNLAWWGYILFINGLIRRKKGGSLLSRRPGDFLWLAFYSAVFWFFWELINLRIANWHYVGVESVWWLRWPGTFLAFATVLPGVLLTARLLEVWGVNWGKGVRPLKAGGGWRPWFLGLGLLMFALPLVWPRLFFPLVWGALVFLLEPSNHKRGRPSLMGAWQKGDLSPFVRLLLAGLICGGVWESLNFLSGARWVYTIPYLAEPRLFAMPLAGFGGFPPFAVECWVFAAWLGIAPIDGGWSGDEGKPLGVMAWPRRRRLALAGAGLIFGLVMCEMMDRYLIRGFAA